MNDADLASIRIDHLPAAERSLRIACVTETYPPEVNGVAATISRIVEGLHARNHDVQLVRPRQPLAAADDDTPFEEVLMRGLPIPRYPDLRMGLPARSALVRLWTRQRPDVVHIATEGPLGWSALQAAEKLKLPVCSDFRTNFHNYSRHYGVGWLYRPIVAYLRKFHNRTDCTMVPTEALRAELESAGFRRLQVVARGVDTVRFDPAHRSDALRESWGAAPGDPVMLYVGRLAAEKNLELLLEAHAAARRTTPRLRLVLVGDGPLRATLEQRCPGAHFAGRRSGEDLAAHYASADLFVFPSRTETFGNVTIEAMASGLPIVAFDDAAAAQLVEPDRHGWLAPLDDAAAFVSHAVALAADAQGRLRMGQAARERAAAQDWRGIVLRFENVLTSAVRRMERQAAFDALAVRGITA